MCNADYKKYVLKECERQWHENQEAEHGKWEDQDELTRLDYYNEMYSLLADNLTKHCCDCRHFGSSCRYAEAKDGQIKGCEDWASC